MAIALTCPNGHALAVADEHAGKRVMCPTCRAVLDVPAAGPAVTIALTCPNGHALLTPPDAAGKRVMCPKCQAVTAVPPRAAAPPPLPAGAYTPAPQGQIQAGRPPSDDYGDVTFEEDDRPRRRPRADRDDEADDRPRRRPRREAEEYADDYDAGPVDRPRKRSGGLKKRQRMKLVNVGLGLHYAGLLIVLIGLLVGLGLPLLMFTGLAGLWLANAVQILMLVAVGLVTPGLWLAGSVLCLYVPPKSGAFPLILASLILNGVALLLMTILWIVLGPLALVGALISIASWVVFMLFLRTLARYLREHGCAEEAMQLIVFFAVLVGAVIAFVAGLYVLAVPMGLGMNAPWLLMGLSGLGGVALLIFEIQFLLRNLQLIGTLRQVIATRG